MNAVQGGWARGREPAPAAGVPPAAGSLHNGLGLRLLCSACAAAAEKAARALAWENVHREKYME